MNRKQKNQYLILTADFPPIEGGISTVTQQLAEGLSQREQLSALGAPQIHKSAVDDKQFPYPVFRIPGYRWGLLRALPAYRPVKKWLLEHRESIDKIIAMNVGFGGFLSKHYQKRFNLPFDTFAYGFEFLKFQRNPVGRKILLGIYNRADRILSISDYTSQKLIDFGVSSERIVRIQLGVDTERFHPGLDGTRFRNQFGDNDKRIILSVGRLITRKGHHLLIQALPYIIQKHPEVVYWIAGRGPEQIALEELVKNLNLEKYVRFLGYINEPDLPSLYAACDLFALLTSDFGASVEGYGLVFLEAGACGKPSLAGRSGGVPEAVIEDKTGIILDYFEPQSIAEQINTLLDHPERIQAMGQAARMWAEERSLERMLNIFQP